MRIAACRASCRRPSQTRPSTPTGCRRCRSRRRRYLADCSLGCQLCCQGGWRFSSSLKMWQIKTKAKKYWLASLVADEQRSWSNRQNVVSTHLRAFGFALSARRRWSGSPLRQTESLCLISIQAGAACCLELVWPAKDAVIPLQPNWSTER